MARVFEGSTGEKVENSSNIYLLPAHNNIAKVSKGSLVKRGYHGARITHEASVFYEKKDIANYTKVFFFSIFDYYIHESLIQRSVFSISPSNTINLIDFYG